MIIDVHNRRHNALVLLHFDSNGSKVIHTHLHLIYTIDNLQIGQKMFDSLKKRANMIVLILYIFALLGGQ